jgi:hypothetical protein
VNEHVGFPINKMKNYTYLIKKLCMLSRCPNFLFLLELGLGKMIFSFSPSSQCVLLQPYFEKSVRMRLTLPKWELGSPPRLPKLQSSISGVKTLHIEAFFISLEIYQSVDVENGLA